MTSTNRLYVLPGILALAAVLAAIIALLPSARQSAAPTVLAAASLQESMNAAADAWAAKGHPRPILSFAGSSALARQIAAGAPADLFVSADEAWMDYLAERGAIDVASRRAFLTNGIVLVAPRDSRVRIALGDPARPDGALARTLADALGEGRLAMADPEAVPAGRYGKAALQGLGAWAAVSSKIAGAENVRMALALVSRGEAPLGIVYGTDAMQDPGVRVVARFPAGSHAPISYPLALVSRSRNAQAADFRAFLLSDEASAIFARFGFGTR